MHKENSKENMVNILNYLNVNEYKLIKHDDVYKLHHIDGTIVNQENYMKYLYKDNRYLFYKVSRNDEYLLGSFKREESLIAAVVTLCYEWYEFHKGYDYQAKELKKAAESGDMDKVVKLLQTECGENYYSLTGVKNHAICLVPCDNLYDICYLLKGNIRVIVKEVEYPRVIFVLRNYANQLKKFDIVYNRIANQISLTKEDYINALEIYLFGKIID